MADDDSKKDRSLADYILSNPHDTSAIELAFAVIQTDEEEWKDSSIYLRLIESGEIVGALRKGPYDAGTTIATLIDELHHAIGWAMKERFRVKFCHQKK